MLDWRVKRCQKRIEEQLHLPGLNLRCLAREFALTESHLGQIFRQHAGIPFRRYLLEVRMERAAALLRTTALSVKEIAGRVGYRHACDLDHRFRARYGVTPLQYRARCRADLADAAADRPIIL
jgi:AraC family transcriptional regulator